MLATRVHTGHDIDIAWFEVGYGDPVVLIHGLADDHRAWRRTAGELMLTRRVILYDLRGQGGTTVGQADGTVTQLARDVVVLLDHLGIERATLAGFSLGGVVAMRAAIDTPDRVDRLALIATSSRVNSAAAAWYVERAQLVDTNSHELRATLDRDTEDVYRHRPEEIAAGLIIRREATADPRGYANACRAMASLREHPLDPELAAIDVPTAILAATDDQHCPPRAAQIIADRIVGSELSVTEDTGHPVPVERPREVAELISRLGDRAE